MNQNTQQVRGKPDLQYLIDHYQLPPVVEDALFDYMDERAELLEALRDLVAIDDEKRAEGIQGYQFKSPTHKKWEAARAAIQKATGAA